MSNIHSAFTNLSSPHFFSRSGQESLANLYHPILSTKRGDTPKLPRGWISHSQFGLIFLWLWTHPLGGSNTEPDTKNSSRTAWFDIHMLGYRPDTVGTTVRYPSIYEPACTCHGEMEWSRLFSWDWRSCDYAHWSPKRHEPMEVPSGEYQLGNFSLQLLVTKGGKCTSTKEVGRKRVL